MSRRMKLSRWMSGAAGIIMIAMAALHAIGYKPLAEQLGSSGIQSAWLGGVKGLWLVFSFHLVILGVLFVAAALAPGWISKPILIIAGLAPAVDTVVLLVFVGIFVGTVSLGLAALLICGSVILRPSAASDGGRNV
jgi:hypothetical protein